MKFLFFFAQMGKKDVLGPIKRKFDIFYAKIACSGLFAQNNIA